jgi:hypothetical protein
MKAFYFSGGQARRLVGRAISKTSIAPCKLTLCRQFSIPAVPVQPSQVKSASEGEKAVSKIAVITGGSTGIGMECAALFSSVGWEVHNISRYLTQLFSHPVFFYGSHIFLLTANRALLRG